MSQAKDRGVLDLIEKLVEKERHDLPALEMSDIRKLVLGDLALRGIEIETNSSAYRKLSRCLRKSFKNSKPYVTINRKEPEWTERGFTEYPTKEAQLEEAVRSMTERGFRLSKDGITWVR